MFGCEHMGRLEGLIVLEEVTYFENATALTEQIEKHLRAIRRELLSALRV